jgi:flagellar biosynthetic protein FlhB
MMTAVPTADVIVTNPTHFAVALKYADGEMRAPKVVAKGVNLVATRIRELALEHNVPLLEAPPLRGRCITTSRSTAKFRARCMAPSRRCWRGFTSCAVQERRRQPCRTPENLEVPPDLDKGGVPESGRPRSRRSTGY